MRKSSAAVDVEDRSPTTIREVARNAGQEAGDAPSRVSQELRTAAQAADERGIDAEVGSIWHALVRGELEVLDTFHTKERWFGVLAEAAAPSDAGEPSRSRASSRCMSLLEPLLFGKRQKVTAIESGVAASTVSSLLHRALTHMGVALTPRKAPAILTLLARAGSGLAVPASRTGRFRHRGRACLTVSVQRPELQLLRKLPLAEYAVLCGIVEGRTYADIARERGTSTRTVANQVASVTHRLGVSGRGELISSLLTNFEFRREVGPAVPRELFAFKKSLFAAASPPAKQLFGTQSAIELTPSSTRLT